MKGLMASENIQINVDKHVLYPSAGDIPGHAVEMFNIQHVCLHVHIFKLKITYLCPRSFIGNRTFTCSNTGPLCFSISCRTAMAINPMALKAEDRSFSWRWHKHFVFTQVIITQCKAQYILYNVHKVCFTFNKNFLPFWVQNKDSPWFPLNTYQIERFKKDTKNW